MAENLDNQLTELCGELQNMDLSGRIKRENNSREFAPRQILENVPSRIPSSAPDRHIPMPMSGDMGASPEPSYELPSQSPTCAQVVRIAVLVDSPPPEYQIEQLKCFLECLGFSVVCAVHSNQQNDNECGYIAIVNVFDFSKLGRSFKPEESLHGQSQQVIEFFNFILGKGKEAVPLSNADVERIISVVHFLDSNFHLTNNFTDIHRLYFYIRKISFEFDILTLMSGNCNPMRSCGPHMDLIVLSLRSILDKAKPMNSKLLRHLCGNVEAVIRRNQKDQCNSQIWKKLAGKYQVFRQGEFNKPAWFGSVCSLEQFKKKISNVSSDRTDDNFTDAVYIVNTEEDPGQHWFTALIMSYQAFDSKQEYRPNTQ